MSESNKTSQAYVNKESARRQKKKISVQLTRRRCKGKRYLVSVRSLHSKSSIALDYSSSFEDDSMSRCSTRIIQMRQATAVMKSTCMLHRHRHQVRMKNWQVMAWATLTWIRPCLTFDLSTHQPKTLFESFRWIFSDPVEHRVYPTTSVFICSNYSRSTFLLLIWYRWPALIFPVSFTRAVPHRSHTDLEYQSKRSRRDDA